MSHVKFQLDVFHPNIFIKRILQVFMTHLIFVLKKKQNRTFNTICVYVFTLTLYFSEH